ncbi:MAG: hypothetical protein H6922_00385 [Pseudomonadaceae bacterium]|nr:hypothetical protein [Pseudomonadaceae bacterium]
MSLEYFHYDGSQDLKDLVAETNGPKVLPFLQAFQTTQTCIMFDDIHSKISAEEFIETTRKLYVKPDSIYGESAYTPLMARLYETLEKRGFGIVSEGGREFLYEKNKSYHHEKKFLLRYENKKEKQFSCPALVAASYLYRLGYFDGEKIAPLWGESPNNQSANILTVLPSRYLQVEANAQSIIQLVDAAFLKRINWYFYS